MLRDFLKSGSLAGALLLAACSFASDPTLPSSSKTSPLEDASSAPASSSPVSTSPPASSSSSSSSSTGGESGEDAACPATVPALGAPCNDPGDGGTGPVCWYQDPGTAPPWPYGMQACCANGAWLTTRGEQNDGFCGSPIDGAPQH